MTHEKRCPHGLPYSHETFDAKRTPPVQWCSPGPSVVTPPTQDEQRPNYCGHESTHAPHLNCCGYQVEFPFSAAPSVSTDHADEKQSCPFCTRLRNGEYTTGADQGVMRFEPLNPVTPGHMLFMPKDHHADAAKLPHVTGFVFAEAARWASIQGEPFNLITSAGADATQTVPHLHVHYVPRRAGDGLSLPWTNQGATAVVAEVDQLRTETPKSKRDRYIEDLKREIATAQRGRDALQAEVEELRRRKRAAEFWERLVRMVVARPEWRTFYEADERGACDEVMIDYLAALQARIDAIAEARSCLGAGPMDYEAFTDEVDRILAAGAALGVDPQKEPLGKREAPSNHHPEAYGAHFPTAHAAGDVDSTASPRQKEAATSPQKDRKPE